MAYSHGVFPLVYNTLKKYDNLINTDKLIYMKQTYMNLVKQNMLMTSELINILKLLEEHNIEAIPFKGPTLSQLAYGDIVSRQYVDLDIFIDKKNAYKIQDILLNKNYKRNLKVEPSQEETWYKYAHDIGFISSFGIAFECHWSMLDTDHPVSLMDLDFFKDTNIIQVQNSEMKAFSNEKFLIYLCVHGAKHLFERIEWVADIDKYIKTQKIDWNYIYNFVQKDNSRKFFLLGLYLASKLYNTTIEKRFTELFDKDVLAVSNYIFSVWNNEEDFDNKNNLKQMLKLFCSRKDKIKYMHKVYLKPTFTEYWYITFPKSLYFLYYPLRQYLLLKKYFLNK